MKPSSPSPPQAGTTAKPENKPPVSEDVSSPVQPRGSASTPSANDMAKQSAPLPVERSRDRSPKQENL